MTDLPVITDPRLAALPGVRHAFFTRRGGVSTGLHASLNVGIGSKDDPDAVTENRRRAAAYFGVERRRLQTVYQIHSAQVVEIEEEDHLDLPRSEGDGLVTDLPAVVCAVLSADCAPVLMVDPHERVVAAVHAGWRGALGGVLEIALAAMVEDYGVDPANVVASVGPCIGPDSYEVGRDFLAAFERDAPGSARFFRPGAADDKRLFNLPGFVLDRLARAGVTDAAWVGRDTFTDEADFYSNRRAVHRADPDYGRLLSAIMLT